VYHHLRPGNLIPEEVTKKAVYRFFRQVSDNVPGLILLSIADKYATAGQKVDEESMRTHKEVLLRMLEEYFKIQEETTPENLVNGNDVMNILNIKPSVKIGKILEEIKLLQMEGKITSKNQAEKFIKTYKEDN
jgi:tRNA nucleotidyltransferase/poly(A) polymerase